MTSSNYRMTSKPKSRTVVASGNAAYLRSLPLKRLQGFIKAYNLNPAAVSAIEKEDFVQLILKAKDPRTGCMPVSAEVSSVSRMTKMLRNMGVAKCHFGDRAFSGDGRFPNKGFCHPRHPQIMLDQTRLFVPHRDLQQGQGRDLQHRVPVRLPDHRNNSRLIDRLPSILQRMAINLGLQMLPHARLNLRFVPPRRNPNPRLHPNACLPRRYRRCHR